MALFATNIHIFLFLPAIVGHAFHLITGNKLWFNLHIIIIGCAQSTFSHSPV